MRGLRRSRSAESRQSVAKRPRSYSRREVEVSRRAGEAEGVIDHGELLECGLSPAGVQRRLRNGRLYRIHEGVYSVGHANLSLEARFVAAVKACGPVGALSHRAAASKLGIRPWTERPVEVTVPGDVTRQVPGLEIHRSSLMSRRDQIVRDGILLTNASWTVVALAAVLPHRELRAAVREALNMKLVSVRSILALLDRLGPVRGSRALRGILAHAVPTRSELEDVVYDLIVGGGFVPPKVNEPLFLEGRKVVPDFRWPEQKLIVEADGARWHDGALSRADDIERQALLERHGETVLRVRWDEATLRMGAARKRLADAGAPLL